MGVAENTNLVHEAEAQRQHARIKLPAKLQLKLKDGTNHRFPIKDLSAGGFRLDVSSLDLELNSQHDASLVFNIDSLKFQLNISFLVKSNGSNGLIGCEFQNLSPQDISTLRFMITSHLSGELISMGDVINTLSRQNFTKERKGKVDGSGMSLFERIKSMTISTVIFGIGLVAFSAVANGIYNNYFLTKATSAKVVVDTISVNMPREGLVHALIKEGQTTVEAGVAIATYKTPLVDALRIEFKPDNPEQAAAIEEVLSKSAEGTITSPCDCEILDSHFYDGEYSKKGESLFTLVNKSSKPRISAYFNYKDLENIVINQSVDVEIAGKADAVKGKIVNIQMAESGTQPGLTNSSSLNVTIELNETIPASFWLRPATVTVTPEVVDSASEVVTTLW